MNHENRKCCEIVDLCYNHFKKTASQVGTTDNIIGIFFHEIVTYATNYYLISNAKSDYKQPLNFPFLNTEYINNTPNLSFDRKQEFKKSLSWKAMEFISKYRKKKIAFTAYVSIDLRSFLRKNVVHFGFFLDNSSHLFVKDRTIQLNCLNQLLEELASILSIEKKSNFISNFFHYVNSFLLDNFPKLSGDLLVTGSHCNLLCRIQAAMYQSAGKTVISLNHANQTFLVLDEPIVGYGELSYCDAYLTFGTKQKELTHKYSKKTLQKMPELYYRSSDFISSYYKGKSVIRKKIDFTQSGLYAPTSFSGNVRYGPFRDFKDEDYKSWQDAICSLKLKLTYKAHPGGIGVEGWNISIPIEMSNLRECLLNYDFYILDYISTASAYIFATDKPVLFFNIGLRNLPKQVTEIVKKRCFWVDIDWDKPLKVQCEQAIQRFNLEDREYVNEFTESFSLTDTSESECLSLRETIRKYI